jgi:hypothetical protein
MTQTLSGSWSEWIRPCQQAYTEVGTSGQVAGSCLILPAHSLCYASPPTQAEGWSGKLKSVLFYRLLVLYFTRQSFSLPCVLRLYGLDVESLTNRMQILLDSLCKHFGRLEASLGISKCNAPFFLSFLPYALSMGAAMGWRFLDSDAAIYSVQTVLLLLAIRPCCTMLIHSQSTNDTRGFNLTSVSLMAVLILNTLVFLPAAVVFFIGHRHPLAWAICPLLMFLMPFAVWRFYEFLYNRGRIDLLVNAR